MSGAVRFDTSELVSRIEHYDRRLRGFNTSLIAEALATAVDDEIQSEGDGSWEPLSPNTIRMRPRRAGGMLLQDTGILAQMQKGAGYNYAEVWSPAGYAGFHVTGTKHMPARDWTDVDIPSVLEMGATFIVNEVAG